MKQIISLVFSLSVIIGASASVNFTISSGIENQILKDKIMQKMNVVLNEINEAESAGRNLDFHKLAVDDHTAKSMSMLWENTPFMVADEQIVEKIITTNDGYQVRNIPLLMKPEEGREFNEDDYQEAVVSFDKKGNIKSFYLTLSLNLYMNVIRDNLELTDLRRRQMILDYVERFRTAYNQKDINFLNQVFSDDALIITGTVVKAQSKDAITMPETIKYNKQSKQQYLSRLATVFRNNKRINVTFDEIKVMRHPANTDFYGVTLHQGYSSDRYHDDGYLFLLWDFQDENAPQIHVRTWQPDQINGSRLPEDEIFNLSDFDI